MFYTSLICNTDRENVKTTSAVAEGKIAAPQFVENSQVQTWTEILTVCHSSEELNDHAHEVLNVPEKWRIEALGFRNGCTAMI